MDIRAKLGISSCLAGHSVRYDGGHKYSATLLASLEERFDLVFLCPEVGIGLPVPRPPIQLVATDRGTRLLGVKDPRRDFTDRIIAYGRQVTPLLSSLSGHVVKTGSPSCGLHGVEIQGNSGGTGTGLYTATIIANNPELPVAEDERLMDPDERADFIERVLVYWRRMKVEKFGSDVLG